MKLFHVEIGGLNYIVQARDKIVALAKARKDAGAAYCSDKATMMNFNKRKVYLVM